jgi:hypothetical protein
MATHATRSELIRAEMTSIRRWAAVISIERAALGIAPSQPFEPRLLPLPKRKPRPIFVFAPKYTKLMLSFACHRAR